MAHDPQVRAAAAADILTGRRTWEGAAAYYKVSKSTLKAWVDDAKKVAKIEAPTGQVIAINRKEQLRENIFDALDASVQLIAAIAKACSDPDFIREKPQEIRDLATTVWDRTDRMVQQLAAPEDNEISVEPDPTPGYPE